MKLSEKSQELREFERKLQEFYATLGIDMEVKVSEDYIKFKDRRVVLKLRDSEHKAYQHLDEWELKEIFKPGTFAYNLIRGLGFALKALQDLNYEYSEEEKIYSKEKFRLVIEEQFMHLNGYVIPIANYSELKPLKRDIKRFERKAKRFYNGVKETLINLSKEKRFRCQLISEPKGLRISFFDGSEIHIPANPYLYLKTPESGLFCISGFGNQTKTGIKTLILLLFSDQREQMVLELEEQSLN